MNFEEPFNKRNLPKLIYNHLKWNLLFKSSSSAIICLTSFTEVTEVNHESFLPNRHACGMVRMSKESIKFISNITNEFYACRSALKVCDLMWNTNVWISLRMPIEFFNDFFTCCNASIAVPICIPFWGNSVNTLFMSSNWLGIF